MAADVKASRKMLSALPLAAVQVALLEQWQERHLCSPQLLAIYQPSLRQHGKQQWHCV
jgi:hypothetical protein